MSFAPLEAASSTSEQVFCTLASRSSQAGSAWVTAMRNVSGDGREDIVYSYAVYVDNSERTKDSCNLSM
jgi:hypothetical protein